MSASPNSTTTPSHIPTSIHVNLGPTLGAEFIGVVLTSIFHGITTLQTITYYQTYPKDRPFLKTLVAVLWVLDTLSLSLVIHGVYTYLVLDFGNLQAADTVVWSIGSEPIVTTVVGLIVNLFLIYRIYALRRQWWLITLLLTIWSLGPFAIGIVTVWRTNTGGKSLSAFQAELRWMAISAGALSSSLDLTIALLLCYLLWQGRGAFKSTNHIIQTIILYVITSGLTAAILHWLTLIFFLTLPAPRTLVYGVTTMLGSTGYVNTLMASLNSRKALHDQPTSALSFPGARTISANTLSFRTAPRAADDCPLQPIKIDHTFVASTSEM